MTVLKVVWQDHFNWLLHNGVDKALFRLVGQKTVIFIETPSPYFANGIHSKAHIIARIYLDNLAKASDPARDVAIFNEMPKLPLVITSPRVDLPLCI